MIYFTLVLLVIMEISLSFDNAVINAKILTNMSKVWQQRFLTWGMLVAVLGMRLVFPVLVVAIASGISLSSVVDMAINAPELYGKELAKSHISISAFGGMFLLMVFLEWAFDPTSEREVFWLTWLEKKLVQLGLLRGAEILLAGSLLIAMQYFIPIEGEKIMALISGLSGILLYTLIQCLMAFFNPDGSVVKNGVLGFIYLEVLDASCSFDGVIGAFALTDNILVIMAGLGIGALAVRSLTVYLVRGGTLKEYIYLEHGAHYGIGALAGIMIVDTFYSVPEPVTGMIGMSMIGLSLLSSIKERKLTTEEK